MAIGKRLRFEILKRDGFKCRYCGANAAAVLLHVDHAIPIAEGGTDDPENLVAACADCNLGKSSVPLQESRLPDPSPTDEMLEHAEQMRAYLDAVAERQRARDAISEAVLDRWCERFCVESMDRALYNSLGYWIDTIGVERVLSAIDATSAAHHVHGKESRRRYFIAVMRNDRDRARSPA